MARSAAGAQPFGFERPDIPGLTDFDEIDLDKLGDKALLTYINYPGIKGGDLVYPRWVGASPAGELFDDVLVELRVPDDVDPAVGVMNPIGNHYIKGAAGGWAFYSFQVDEARPENESLRRFCYVGVRPRLGAETLSVVLAAPSHGLIVAPQALDTTMALLVPPYQAMQAGDRVSVTLTGEDDRGRPYTWNKVLSVEVAGELLQAAVERTWLRRLEGGHFDAEYVINFKDGNSAASPVQRFKVDSKATPPVRLPAPSVEGLKPGEPLDPARFRDGLTIRIAPYPEQGMALSDRLLLYWLSSDHVYQTLRVDPSTLASGALVFTLEPRWLMSSQGQDVALGYQFARAGSSLSSNLFNVNVLVSRELERPIVLDAVAEKDGGRMPAYLATSGVLVDVPSNVEVIDGERIELHWWGDAERGREIVTEPIGASRPRRFRVSAASIAANMERNENAVAKRFKVFYRLVKEDGSHVESEAFMLRILPLEITDFPRLACPDAKGEDLWLKDVPGGARYTLDPWTFIAAKQWVTLWVSGVWRNEVEEVLRDGEVTPAEVGKGIEVLLPKAVLEQQMLNESFTVHAHISFDGKQHYFAMRSLSLTLRA